MPYACVERKIGGRTFKIETGKVANAGFWVSLAPIIPPRVTRTIAPVAEISWQTSSMRILRRDMRAHSHTFGWPDFNIIGKC